MGNGEESNGRSGFGADSAGFLSTRNILVAAIVASLGGSGTAFVQSTTGTADRWTGEQHKEYAERHRQIHDGERALILAELKALQEKVNRNDRLISNHQDGHPERVLLEVERLGLSVEENSKAIRQIERFIDRNLNGER